MNVADTPSTGPRGRAPVARVSLRVLAVVIVVLLIGEILLGNQLALAGSPYPFGYLAAHVVLAVLLVGATAGLNNLSFRQPRWIARISAVVTFVASVGAAFAGTAFLYAGQGSPALDTMEALGGVALLGSILLIVWGGRTPENATAPPRAK
jgi:hypothetical protein